MRYFFLHWHNLFFGVAGKYRLKERVKPLWALCGVNWKIADFFFNKCIFRYGKLNKFPKAKLSGSDELVVSLTTFPARINTVWIVIDSMLRQKTLPSKICLYLANEEFPDGQNSLPQRLLDYKPYGLEICFRDINLMAHNKYFFALQEYPNSCVITVDDDMYYNDNLISNLLELHKQYPGTICSNTIHSIDFENDGSYKPYNNWILRPLWQKPSHRNIALGYNGVLYPPLQYAPSMFDVDAIRNTAPKADDLWLKGSEINQNIKVTNGKYFCTGIEIGGSQINSLNAGNVISGQNDQQWLKVCDFFGINKKTICK